MLCLVGFLVEPSHADTGQNGDDRHPGQRHHRPSPRRTTCHSTSRARRFTSSTLPRSCFASASGYAGGFLAKDWHSASAAELGALSFEEHRKLAEKEGGRENWGYSQSVTVSYEAEGRMAPTESSEDWLNEGMSRVSTAKASEKSTGEIPRWLRRVHGDAARVIDQGQGTALV